MGNNFSAGPIPSKRGLVPSHLLGDDGYLNEAGQDALVLFLERLNPKRWGKAFIPLKKKGVHTAIELVIVWDGKVLLTWRDDKFFRGWHTPGTYLEQGETWQDAAQRCADRELKTKVYVVNDLKSFNHPESPRFHDHCTLLLCDIVGEPQTGQWFSEMPQDLIPVHQKYWPTIQTAIINHTQDVKTRSLIAMELNDAASFGYTILPDGSVKQTETKETNSRHRRLTIAPDGTVLKVE